jgi:hypothetical protein
MIAEDEILGLSKEIRLPLWKQVSEAIETYFDRLRELPIVPEMDPAQIRAFIEKVDFDRPTSPADAVNWAVEGLSKYQMHWPHPRCFGHTIPASSTMGIAADTLIAAFNPQLATWRSSPFAVEVEQHVLKSLGALFGYRPQETQGCFTSGGTEANHHALLTALAHRFPEFADEGLIGLNSRPIVYMSEEAHHSHTRSARLCGLGSNYVRKIPTNSAHRMSSQALREQIHRDQREGLTPLMVVGTVGTTNTGASDPIGEIAEIAKQEKSRFHLDGAWAGAAFSCQSSPKFGSERVDSITLMPQMVLRTHGSGDLPHPASGEKPLEKIFRFTSQFINLQHTVFIEVVDPHYQSMQWSSSIHRAKAFLTLAVADGKDTERSLRHQLTLGKPAS